jgi:quinol monooxygenase YgiN
MYEVLLTVAVKLACRERFEAVMRELCARTVADDPGCQRYEWYRAESGPTYYLLERWTDEAAVLAHARAGHCLELVPQLMECTESDFIMHKMVRVA